MNRKYISICGGVCFAFLVILMIAVFHLLGDDAAFTLSSSLAPETVQPREGFSVAHGPAAGALRGASPVIASRSLAVPLAAVAEVEDRYAGLATIAEETSRPDADGVITRVRLVSVESKHRYHRLEEKLRMEDDGTMVLVRQHAMAADHIVVVLEDAVSVDIADEVFAQVGLSVHSETGIPGGYLVHMDTEVSLDTVPQLLASAADVHLKELAEPNFVYWLASEPNDTRYGEQWGLDSISMPQVWGAVAETTKVIVAVFDTGTTLWHEDLQQSRWVNEDEVEGNATDDDGNGYVDDRYGWNFSGNNNDPSDLHGHGTHVHGIIGATGNNSMGISGVGWNIRTMPIAFIGPTGHGYASDAASGLYYVHEFASRGIPVRVANHSWGGSAFSAALSNAFVQTSGDILHVAAAGNSTGGNNNDLEPFYPASLQIPNMISVANLTSTGSLNRDSHFGADSVHLAAPGTSVLSTLASGGYGLKSGTSMAAPHVAGVLALLLDTFPEKPPLEIRAALLEGTHAVPTLHGQVSTGGRLDAVGAFTSVSPLIEHVPHPDVDTDLAYYEIFVTVRPGVSLLAPDGVKLLWDTSAEFSDTRTVTMVHVGNGTYRGEIPGRPFGNRVYYWIEVEGINGTKVTDPLLAPEIVHTFDITFPVPVHIQGLPFAMGMVEPAYGSHSVNWGQDVTFTAPAHTPPTEGMRWRNIGWNGAGSVPSVGTTNVFTAAIRGTSYVAWLWRRQYVLDMSFAPDIPSLSSYVWWDEQHFAQTAVAPDLKEYDGVPHRFIGWFIDGLRHTISGGTRAANPVSGIRMDRAVEAVAHYVPKSLDSDGDGLPDWWQLYHFGHLDYGADDDVDGDGFTNAQEYADRSDPNAPHSFPEGPVIDLEPLAQVLDDPGPWQVRAFVTDRVDIAEVRLHWRLDGAIEWNVVHMDAVEGDPHLYAGDIYAPLEPGLRVVYQVFAEDIAQNVNQTIEYHFFVDYPVLVTEGLTEHLTLLGGEDFLLRVAVTNIGTAAWNWEPLDGHVVPAAFSVSASGVNGGSIGPGETGWLEWRVDTTGLEPGVYQTGWSVTGNAPLQPEITGFVYLEVRPYAATTIQLQQDLGDASASNELVIRWHTEPGKVYSLLRSSNLGLGGWQGVPGYTNLPGGGIMSYTGRIDLLPRQFYRVVEEEP